MTNFFIRRFVLKKIREQVKKILKEQGKYNIPVDVFEIARNEGFEILQQDLDGASGAILVNTLEKFEIDKNEYNKVILIDNYQTNARKNFTIAHELGHYFLEFNGEGQIFAHREDATSHQPAEQQASNFASELLMPYELLDNFVKEIKKKYKNYYLVTSAISEAFNVSQPAAEYRYNKYLKEV